MNKQTKALHTRFGRKDPYQALSMPVYHSVAFEFDDAHKMELAFTNQSNDPDYSRTLNPTVIYYEDKVKDMTGAVDVMALSSGMAAITTAIMAVAKAGSNVVTSCHVFGNTYVLLVNTLGRFGIETRLVDMTKPEEVEKAIDENTCCVYLEAVTNPQMEVADLKALSEVAHRHGLPLIVDTTIIPFTDIDAHALGIDVQVVSSTKYLSGGATSIGGLILDFGGIPGFSKRVRQELILNLGTYMTPHAAYMQTIGLETLEARYRVMAANALEVARRLQGDKRLLRVTYPGLEEHPQHELAQRQFGKDAGAMVTIDLPSREACFRFINALKMIRRATNLFDNKSLAIHPASTIFGNMSAEDRAAMDVLDTTIRLSIGLEHADDIYNDIDQALAQTI